MEHNDTAPQPSRRTAPYEVGGTVRLLHTNRFGADVVADLPVIEVTPMTDGRWRVLAEREGVFPHVTVTVRADGFDDDGYIQPSDDGQEEAAS